MGPVPTDSTSADQKYFFKNCIGTDHVHTFLLVISPSTHSQEEEEDSEDYLKF